MKILVTGGAGFIGHHLVKQLIERGDSVIVVDNLTTGSRERVPQEAYFIEGDVLDIATIEIPHEIDAIIHMAAQIDVHASENDPMNDAEQNILGTIAVLDFAKQHGVKKVVFSSSAAVYGDADSLPVREQYGDRPKVAYGASKRCAELYMQLYGDMHAVETVSLRYANVYGPGQDGSKESGVIAVFCRKVKNNDPLTINGDGSITRDFIYVEDIARANIAALAPGVKGTFNISNQQETSLQKLVEILEEASGKKIEVTYASEKYGDIQHSCLENQKALQQLEWEPIVDLQAGLMKTLNSH